MEDFYINFSLTGVNIKSNKKSVGQQIKIFFNVGKLLLKRKTIIKFHALVKDLLFFPTLPSNILVKTTCSLSLTLLVSRDYRPCPQDATTTWYKKACNCLYVIALPGMLRINNSKIIKYFTLANGILINSMCIFNLEEYISL